MQHFWNLIPALTREYKTVLRGKALDEHLPDTVTKKVHVSVFSATSVAVYVTVVFPIVKLSPESWVDISVWTPALSVAVGDVQFTTAVATALSVVTVWSPGHPLMTGFSLSVKNIIWDIESVAFVKIGSSSH